MTTETRSWLPTLRAYLLIVVAGTLVWEVLQLPLYTVWQEPVSKMAFAVAHCTAGDALIALDALMIALLIAGASPWPKERFATVAALTIVFGIVYTVFSERLNVSVRQSWTYSEWMPVVPLLDVGLSPLMQWIVVPLLGFWRARRRDAFRSSRPNR